MVVLQDQTEVYLGVFNTPEAHRPKAERKKLHGRMVRITGRVFRRMPTVGQGPLAPCICEISSIEIVEPN
jgi:hypothetical protein